ncbi:hypothetical protein IMZ31_19275 (plasmid) [Pontibacillus sp. ALD_SL1]|uniref:hypothetical protein n=1 Tax=Pontibacillus sp. ALD_SL1 TaxID=2777185 RepID=UPI001A963BB3|nr:hypothetical protein [Pontibacillus sp. ALD_SL1]QST02692.1 hypothetical protein IMZ31_19275 [Pontibacillus sp. ALD_SL1]
MRRVVRAQHEKERERAFRERVRDQLAETDRFIEKLRLSLNKDYKKEWETYKRKKREEKA